MSYALVPGNRITLLRSGVEYFPALEAAIRAARREIYLESYLYEADETGRRVTNALADAARRGVAVHVLVDGFGAKAMPPEMVQALARAGAERGIMLAGLILGEYGETREAVAALRPWARNLLITQDEDDVGAVLTALRA